jgi:cell division inhibitor SepF
MASGIVRKAMVYLGLTDDEYEDYEVYDDTSAASNRRPAEPVESAGATVSAVRPMRESAEPSNGVTVTPRPAQVRPLPQMQHAKVHVVVPLKFADAQEIGDRFKSGQPVIVNLQTNDPQLARRMIDFCSGVTYALAGSMDKVAEQVFLLTPSNVEVSAEEKRRLQERGLYRT